MKTSNTQILPICLALVAMTALPSGASAHSVEDGLRQCAAIADNDERLRCFDALAAETTHAVATAPPAATTTPEPAAQAPTESAPAAPPAAPAAASGVQPVSDDFGLSRIEGRDGPAPTKYSATVTRCEESKQSGQYYFFFENGQLWKQTNYKTLRWRDCDFDVTVSKGTFGYEMYVPEKDRTVRVTRIR